MDNLLLGNSSKIVRFSFLLCLCNFLFNGFHFLDVVIQKVFFQRWIVLWDSVVYYGLTLDSKSLNKSIEFFVFFQKVHSSGFFTEYEVSKDIHAGSGLLEHAACDISECQSHTFSQHSFFGSLLTEECPY